MLAVFGHQVYIRLQSDTISIYEFTSNWHIKVPTQLPFELKLRMPSTDRGGRGYSDEYIAEIEQQLYSA